MCAAKGNQRKIVYIFFLKKNKNIFQQFIVWLMPARRAILLRPIVLLVKRFDINSKIVSAFFFCNVFLEGAERNDLWWALSLFEEHSQEGHAHWRLKQRAWASLTCFFFIVFRKRTFSSICVLFTKRRVCSPSASSWQYRTLKRVIREGKSVILSELIFLFIYLSVQNHALASLFVVYTNAFQGFGCSQRCDEREHVA